MRGRGDKRRKKNVDNSGVSLFIPISLLSSIAPFFSFVSWKFFFLFSPSNHI